MGTLDTVSRAAFAARVASLAPALDVLGLPACLLDRDLRYHYVNPAYAAHSGHAAGSFPGRTPLPASIASRSSSVSSRTGW